MFHQSSLGNEAIMVEAKGGEDWRPSSDRVRRGLAPANTNNTVAILYTCYTGQPRIGRGKGFVGAIQRRGVKIESSLSSTLFLAVDVLALVGRGVKWMWYLLQLWPLFRCQVLTRCIEEREKLI